MREEKDWQEGKRRGEEQGQRRCEGGTRKARGREGGGGKE